MFHANSMRTYRHTSRSLKKRWLSARLKMSSSIRRPSDTEDGGSCSRTNRPWMKSTINMTLISSMMSFSVWIAGGGEGWTPSPSYFSTIQTLMSLKSDILAPSCMNNRHYTSPLLNLETGPKRRLFLFLFRVLGLLLLLADFQSTKTFSFHNRSSLVFTHRLVTTFFTIAPCRIFKLSPN